MQAHARSVLMFLGLALPAVVLAGQTSSGCVFRLSDGCVVTLGYEDGCQAASAAISGTGGHGGTGGAGSTGGTGGGGGPASTGTGGKTECTSTNLSACQAVPPGPCASLGKQTCTKGKCGISYKPGDAPSQKYGSCKKKVCDGTGAATDINDDSNVYDDGNLCIKKTCAMGVPGEAPLNNAACTVQATAMSGFCENDPYNAQLVTCLTCNPADASTCAGMAGTTCVKGSCLPIHCSNGTKDPGETDVDCGGTSCLRCPPNKVCATYKDCATSVCVAGVCQPATCSDGRQNQDETDVDCGGTSGCALCGDTLTCILGSDCLNGVCKSSSAGMPNTCQPPACNDGVKNGDETGIDCGGVISKCPPCW